MLADDDWNLVARTDGSTVETVSARKIFSDIAQAAWECADPGVQFDTTINNWHTSPSGGRITSSNPCSEYLHVDNSACNLASINLLSFLDDDGTFDIEGFRHAARLLITAQEILVGNSSYPTEKIGETTRRYRQLGLGYTNLGALLMAQGLAYDSETGRAQAGAITALMTGEAYRTSARIAARMGAYEGFTEDRPDMLRVLGQHRDALDTIDSSALDHDIMVAARSAWDDACSLAETCGVRNAQATVLAPTGTISFMMDCDTTGIEPEFALVKYKTLSGGGNMSIVNQTVPRALRHLGYMDHQVADIVDHISETGAIAGAPHLFEAHVRVFDCSVGDDAIAPRGHVAMMAAAQPFLSGAISKTVNMPEAATATDIEELVIESWQLGVKAVAVYRDNCKVFQPLNTSASTKDAAPATLFAGNVESARCSTAASRSCPREATADASQPYLRIPGRRL